MIASGIFIFLDSKYWHFGNLGSDFSSFWLHVGWAFWHSCLRLRLIWANQLLQRFPRFHRANIENVLQNLEFTLQVSARSFHCLSTRRIDASSCLLEWLQWLLQMAERLVKILNLMSHFSEWFRSFHATDSASFDETKINFHSLQAKKTSRRALSLFLHVFSSRATTAKVCCSPPPLACSLGAAFLSTHEIRWGNFFLAFRRGRKKIFKKTQFESKSEPRNFFFSGFSRAENEEQNC